jgi:hypothetical protein
MKITEMAVRLRKVAVDMEEMAAKDGDLDFPDEVVLPFILNALTDNRMLEERPAAAATADNLASDRGRGS